MPSNNARFIKFFLFLTVLCAFQGAHSQSVNIIVKNKENATLPGAVVQIFRFADTTSAGINNITNSVGEVHFTLKLKNRYRIRISYLGYKTLQDTLIVTSEHQRFEYQLTESAITMGLATVNAQKPLIRQEDDKMIIDPMPLINSSSNTMEVLEKTPGLYVDQDGNIYLSSTISASIYINGNELKMSTEDIATMLRSLPPNSVDRIEVMRTPSTKFDAASSGGIINIILKKGVKIGQTGSVNIGLNQGYYGNRFAGYSLNYSGDKTTSYLNMNYNHNELREQIHSVRTLATDTLLHQTSSNKQQSEQGYIGYGINYESSKKLSLSYDGRLSLSFPDNHPQSSSQIKNIENLLFENENQSHFKADFVNIQQDFGCILKFDTLGSNLDTKFNYSFNSNNSRQAYLSDITFPLSQILEGDGTNHQQRHYLVFQSDLTYKLPLKFQVECGIKISYQDYKSSSEYVTINNGIRNPDTLRTNAFNYVENINAGYAQMSKTFGKWFTLKTGVRLEQTYMKGNQTIPADTSFLVNRTDWFPYIYISRELFKIFGIKLQGFLIYRRTINRPDYQSLNPYIKYIDEFTYETGNPSLKPQFTNNYEFNVSFNDIPVLAFGQNLTTDIFSNIVNKDPNNRAIAIRTLANLGSNKESYFRLILGIPPGQKFFFALGAQYNYSDYSGYMENQSFHFKRGSWRLFTFQALNIAKQTKINLNGFLMLNGNQNFYTLKDFGQLNLGITQTLFNKKLTLTLNLKDVLHSMVTNFQYNQAGIVSYGDRYMDNQRLGINLRYVFGMKKKDEKHGFNEPGGEY